MSATADTQAGSGGLRLTRDAGARTFFIWAGLSLLGFPLGGYLGHLIAGPVDGVMPALLGGALTGAGIGVAQWFLLRRILGMGLEWIAATSIGLAVGLPIGALTVDYETSISQLAIMGAISGATVGLAQGLLLRDKFSLWPVWVVTMPALWALGWVVTEAAGIDVEKQFTVFGASGTVVFAILSGLLLLAGMRRDKSSSV
jgi:hypothetical protein